MNAAWTKYLPSFIRTKLEGRHRLQAIISNSGWLFADRILRMAVSLFVGAWVARYLGPEQFGLMSYASALVMILAGTLGSLGLKQIVIRDLVRDPENAALTLGTAFVLQLAAGLLVFVLSLLVIDVINPGNDLARTIVAVMGFATVFKASEPMRYWFESQVQSRYAVIADNAALFVMAAARIVLILLHAPLMAFVWVVFVESAVASILLACIYAIKVGGLRKWTARVGRARALLAEGWPVILAAGASMLNMRLDQVMLGTMTSNTVVGNYSAAVRIAEVWLAFPLIIGSSIYPSIVAAKEVSEDLYKRRILKVTAYMAAITLPTAILISLTSSWISRLLFGPEFASTGSFLALMIWTGVPYMILFAVSQMYFVEGMTKFTFYLAIVSAGLNVIFNLRLIPEYGGMGAIIATLISTYTTSIVSVLIIHMKTGLLSGPREPGSVGG